MRTNILITPATFMAAATLTVASPALALTSNFEGARPMPYEQQLAMQEADQILAHPIAGVENHYWFNYLTDVSEARHELHTDLRHVSDSEDFRDAWEEYRHELVDAKKDYAKAMRKKGYPVGVVYVEGD